MIIMFPNLKGGPIGPHPRLLHSTPGVRMSVGDPDPPASSDPRYRGDSFQHSTDQLRRELRARYYPANLKPLPKLWELA